MKALVIFIFSINILFAYGNVDCLWDYLIKVEGKKIIREPTGDYSKYGLRTFFIKKYNKKYSTTYTIKSLSEKEGKKIFEEFFYKKYLIDRIENKKLRILIVDTIYNKGTSGIKLIQSSINKSAKDFTIKIDGRIGEETILGLNKVDFNSFKINLKKERIDYYKTRKNFKKYGNGWLKRLDILFE